MKKVLAIFLIIAAGCSDNKDKIALNSHRSRIESAISNLVDSFKTDYASAATDKEKNAVISAYHDKTDKFLSKHYLNHMHVHIDSVIINHLKIDTRFHAGENLLFTSSTEFHKPMPAKEDSLFQFMKHLKQGIDTNIDFMYIGKFELRPPNDSLKSILTINAYPLSYQVHGRR
jgi:hypothetical protein